MIDRGVRATLPVVYEGLLGFNAHVHAGFFLGLNRSDRATFVDIGPALLIQGCADCSQHALCREAVRETRPGDRSSSDIAE